MDIVNSLFWPLLGGVLLATELLTGTFYLLMLALGAVAAWGAEALGVPFGGQLVLFAVVSTGCALALYRSRRHRQDDAVSQSSRDVNLDIGEIIMVRAWEGDGSARVRYRGAEWTARKNAPGPDAPGPWRIVRVSGSTLYLEPEHDPATGRG